MSVPFVRTATARDADALTRVHVEGGLDQVVTAAWRETHRADLAHRLLADDPGLVAVVALDPDGAGIVSAAVGFIHQGLRRPDNVTGRSARLASVATLHGFRGRGYATAAVDAFVAAVGARGCTTVTLTATDAGGRLYRKLGFTPAPRAMSLSLPAGTSAPARRPVPPHPFLLELG